ncbi:MCE family protein [Actinocorallia aurantiaca]|uniref:Phospholipid/cholesterol/gamma-HCH transport system substrate-binding protein n=1 Tax=Actinocorallia aurantiaca TaxID=46204 RepID=A0ABN3U6M1_9ACTN
MRRLLPLLALVTALGASSACTPSTLGAPTGKLTLVARFSDAQNLVAGHSVQMSDIQIGSVTKVRLVGYEAEVTISVEDEYRIPAGTSAEVAQTSLLGENYVKLTLPEGGDMARGPHLQNGARIERTSVAPQFEQVADSAGEILRAISGDDVATLLNEGATALEGQGPKLNDMVAQSGDLLAIVAGQREELGDAIDQLAKLGRMLEKHEASFASGDIERTIGLIDDNKEKIIHTVDRLTATARQLNDKVFVGRAEKMRTMLKRLDPTLETIGSSTEQLNRLVASLAEFQEVVPKVVYDGQLLLFGSIRAGFRNDASKDDPSSLLFPFLDQIIQQGGGR